MHKYEAPLSIAVLISAYLCPWLHVCAYVKCVATLLKYNIEYTLA